MENVSGFATERWRESETRRAMERRGLINVTTNTVPFVVLLTRFGLNLEMLPTR